jgi:hypothetical protein
MRARHADARRCQRLSMAHQINGNVLGQVQSIKGTQASLRGGSEIRTACSPRVWTGRKGTVQQTHAGPPRRSATEPLSVCSSETADAHLSAGSQIAAGGVSDAARPLVTNGACANATSVSGFYCFTSVGNVPMHPFKFISAQNGRRIDVVWRVANVHHVACAMARGSWNSGGVRLISPLSEVSRS